MKRTVPLIITGVSGLILVVSTFIPSMVRLGEDTAVWFDLLAGIAFILGGGNLLKVHLKKMSDQTAGWGYSAVTVVAFLLTLYFGLFKIGVSPEASTEYYGQSFVHFPLESMPTFSVPGTIPERADGEPLPASAIRNLSDEGGQIVFQGWMSNRQKSDLLEYEPSLEWQCLIEQLHELAQPKFASDRVVYHSDHETLGFIGLMSDDDFRNLSMMLADAPGSKAALETLRTASRVETRGTIPSAPEAVTVKLAPAASGDAEPDAPTPAADSTTLPPDDSTEPIDEAPQISDYLRINEQTLTITGPMSEADRENLAEKWPDWARVRPIPGADEDEFKASRERLTDEFIAQLMEHGPELNSDQREAVLKQFGTVINAQQIIDAVNAAGVASEGTKTACELLEERRALEQERAESPNNADEPLVLDPEIPAGENVVLSEEQEQLIRAYANDPAMTIEQLSEQLAAAETTPTDIPQVTAGVLRSQQTVAAFKRQVALVALKAGPLSKEQQEFLFADYRDEFSWRQAIDELFVDAHVPKYPWSGSHEQEGSLFWWCYTYLFRPLTSTMFAMLAFYVASAAFRAFRAKNVEALLLLGTAFIILLGRTFVGVWITDWIPPEYSAFKVDELTVYVMQIFNVAGNRAIMIGIALGVASTSLKVLLGVDRSYLGSGDD